MLNRQIGPSIFNTSSLTALRIVNIGVKIDQSCSTLPTRHPGGENTSILCEQVIILILLIIETETDIDIVESMIYKFTCIQQGKKQDWHAKGLDK